MPRQMPPNLSPFETVLFDRASFTIGSETSDAINVGIQLKVGANDLDQRGAVLCYLSDNANGDTIISGAPSGGVAIGSDGLAIPLVTNKAFLLVSEADGDIDITITDTSARTIYVVLVMPSGELVVSAAVTFAATTTTTTTGA